MRIRRNIWILLVLVCLLMNAIPMAFAEGTEEDRQGLDYSELEHQVAVANGLTAHEYTKESWAPLQAALDTGNKRLEGIYNQGKLDSAAEEIEAAIEGLVKMDYSALDTVLDAVNAKINGNPEQYDAWYRLSRKVDEAKPLLVSGDQEAVNTAAAEINQLLEELATYITEPEEPEVLIQEVEVEVFPTTDFCNIPVHRIWPVLFVISGVLNVGLVVLLIYVLVKKRNTTDTTPLVNYDIDEDMDI